MADHRIVHTTRYEFRDAVVGGCVVDTRLEPRACAGQEVAFHQLVVRPLAAHRTRVFDGFGNPSTRVRVEEPFGMLEFTAVSTVRSSNPADDVQTRPPPVTGLHERWRRVVGAAAGTSSLDALRGASRRVEPGVLFAEYAASSFTEHRTLDQALHAFLGQIREDFCFDAEATTVDTSLDAFFVTRRGVCQDFAHLTIACLRSLGLPARYVSGYLLPPRGSTGRTQSHAWVSLWVGLGDWLDLDPTAGRVGPLGHVTLGWGRDYDDVAPVSGAVEHRGACRMTTNVRIDSK